jgi:Zinc dependent phospholipase C
VSAAFVHLQVSKDALSKVFSDNRHNLYRKVMTKFQHFVLLGSVSPDYPYLAYKITGVDYKVSWGDILHNVRTATNVSIGLRFIRAEADKGSDNFLMKLAWLMGYYSHVMTDVVVHPVVYRIIGGPYTEKGDEHTRCELVQDSMLCFLLKSKDAYNSYFLKSLGMCSDESAFTLDMDPTHKVIKKPVADFWKKILKRNYPYHYNKEEPNLDAWHRSFLKFMPFAIKGQYIFGKLPVDPYLTYKKFKDISQEDRDRNFYKIDLPDKRYGDFRTEVFSKAIDTVVKGWDKMLDGLTDPSALMAFEGSLNKWCLDDGTTDHINYSLWAGKTSDGPLVV